MLLILGEVENRQKSPKIVLYHLCELSALIFFWLVLFRWDNLRTVLLLIGLQTKPVATCLSTWGHLYVRRDGLKMHREPFHGSFPVMLVHLFLGWKCRIQSASGHRLRGSCVLPESALISVLLLAVSELWAGLRPLLSQNWQFLLDTIFTHGFPYIWW